MADNNDYNYNYNDSYGDYENPDFQMDKKLKKEFDREYQNKKKYKKETKVWHWIVMDLLMIGLGVAGAFLTSVTMPLLGVISYGITPLLYVISFMIISFLPMIPSGIRTFYTWTMTKVVVFLLIFFLGCDFMLPGFQDKIVNLANEMTAVVKDNNGHLSNEEVQEMIRKNLADEEDKDENVSDATSENGQNADEKSSDVQKTR